jgi:uncharacterized protein with PIN domain
MFQALFRFHAELNDLLPPDRRERFFSYSFASHQSLKHLVEALGIPHTEVGSILANGKPVSFSYRPAEAEQIEVFPAIPDGAERSFLLDNHLGRLAFYLRMLGFDCLYRNDYQDDELAAISRLEQRTLLTRDRRLLMRTQVYSGYSVRSLNPQEQVGEVLRRFNLFTQVRPFRRCMRCNGMLKPVDKAQVLDRLEHLTKIYFEEFRQCEACDQVYWKGSHFERMQEFIKKILPGAETASHLGKPPAF